MQVVITGVTGFRNRGVEAIVQTTVEGVRAQDPSAAITVQTTTPDYDSLRLPDDVALTFNELEHPFSRVNQLRFLAGAVNRRLSPARKSVEAIVNADVVVATGGDLFSSDYGTNDLHLRPLVTAAKAGVPFGFLGQSVGPFKGAVERDRFARVASQAAFFTVREDASYEYVLGVGLDPQRVVRTSDPAFVLSSCSDAEARRLIAVTGVPEGRRLVGVVPSQGITSFSPTSSQEHLQAWVRIVDGFTDEPDTHVLLLAHVQEGHALYDDRILSADIARAVKQPSHVSVVGGDWSAAEFKGIIGRCDFVVAERMHAAIAALSQAVPAWIVGYSVKAGGILRDALGDQGDQCLIPIADFVSPRFTLPLSGARDALPALVRGLTERLPEVKARAAENFAFARPSAHLESSAR